MKEFIYYISKRIWCMLFHPSTIYKDDSTDICPKCGEEYDSSFIY